MLFSDRFAAAKELAKKLEKYKGGGNTVILAIPRGGVQTGYILAKELKLPLDIVLTKKIGYPGNSEYAIGAVSLKSYIVDKLMLKTGEISQEYIEKEVLRIRKLLKARYKKYLGEKNPCAVRGKTVVITDDGVATGRTIMAAIDLLREDEPEKIVVAVPVGPPDTINELKNKADEVICVLTPEIFYAIGQFYYDFTQVEDDEAIRLLEEANKWKCQ
jgi:predicted phosphoribosyltransferase